MKKLKKEVNIEYSAVIIKADEIAFSNLLSAGKVKVLWSVCSVYEVIPVLAYYKCSRHGHMEQECISDREICGSCTGSHKALTCTSKSFKCINCLERNVTFQRNDDVNHAAWSFKCPVLKRNYSKKIATKKRQC